MQFSFLLPAGKNSSANIYRRILKELILRFTASDLTKLTVYEKLSKVKSAFCFGNVTNALTNVANDGWPP